MRHCNLIVIVLVIGLGGCGSFPKNPKLEQFKDDSGYRFGLLQHGANSDRLFIIVTFSGGGTRAAALAFGVLEALRDTPIQWEQQKTSLLEEVDVISSISGGSFAAGYYALHGTKIFQEFPEQFLYRPLQSELLDQLFFPGNWLKLAGFSYGRGDLAAEYYDETIFDGKTFADIIHRNRRPFVILNATDMTTGQQFPFIQDQFDLICSDLAKIPVARAAAASSAFPGALTALTLQNYSGECNYQQPDWVSLAAEDHGSRISPGRTALAEQRLSYTQPEPDRRDFIHLIDGGVADNIGLRGPLAAIRSTDISWSPLSLINTGQVDKLVIIVVNASTDPDTERDASPDVPDVVDTIAAAATVPLDNYSFDTLQLLNSTVNRFNEDHRLIEGCKTLVSRSDQKCTIEIPAPHRVDLFPIQVAFEYIESEQERKWYKNLPTSFELPRETVDKLRTIARELLSKDPEFKRLLAEIRNAESDPQKN